LQLAGGQRRLARNYSRLASDHRLELSLILLIVLCIAGLLALSSLQ